jgi:predicted permease
MSWFRRLANAFRPARAHDDIARELSFHLAERRDELRAGGMNDHEAARRARLQFGNVTAQAERTADVDVARGLENFLRDVRYGLRTLARSPGFTAAVVSILGLGIGANSAVFSALNAVVLQPLPFPDGDRLMRLAQVQPQSAESNIAPARLEDWNSLTSSFDAITGYFTENVSETSGDLPERIRRVWVAPRFLDVCRIAPALGRGFTDAEYAAGGPSAVLISDRYWRRRFAADPNVVGRTIRIGRASSPIVGVMPASFQFPDREADVWSPVALSDTLARVRSATWYIGIGRLGAGVTIEQARANLAFVQTQLGEQFPETDRTLRVTIAPLKDATVGAVRSSLWLLFGAVSLLLLITCTNVAALLLSRAAHRGPEMSVRLSLGATRGALAAQMLIETGVLSLGGSAVGLLVAVAGSAALRAAAIDLPRADEIAVDGPILLYTLAIALTVTFVCGLLPALRAARGRVAGAANEAGRAQVSIRTSLQWLLVGTQMALSVTLLAGAGLLVRSVQELSRVDPGFDPSRVLTFHVSGNWAETADYRRLVQRIEGTLEALRGLPGVEAAATAVFLPGVPAQYESTFELVEASTDRDVRIVAEGRPVSRDYFRTLRIPLIGGEPCGDSPDSSGALLVNSTFVSRYLAGWPSAVGLHLSTRDSSAPPGRIVGIVADARERGLDRDPAPVVYTCVSAPNPTPYFLLRTRGEPAALGLTIRVKMKELEPARALYEMAPLTDRIGDAFAQNRLRTVLLALFAGTALLLACVGLYGTLSYAVNLRRREVGLRLALGATRRDIIRQFLGQALRVTVLASICGVALSLAFTRVLSTMLYGVSPSDPATLSTVMAIVLVVAGFAALVPATRAALVEPMRVLRDQ